MAEESATVEVTPELKELGDKIADLTLKQAIELSDYLKDEHSIEPAASGGVMMAAAGGDGGAEEVEQTEFDVVLTGFGDKKLNVVKEVKAITSVSLMDAKKMVEDTPTTIKEKVDKEEAEKVKAQLEEAGASVELK